MTLTTHIVFAGAVTKPLIGNYNPLLIFVVAFASHFILDAIPHFDYKLLSAKEEDSMSAKIVKDYKLISKDLVRIGTDILVGSVIIVVTYSFLEITFPAIIFIAVIIGAIMPDALQPVYWLSKNSLLKPLHKFHVKIQEKREIKSPLLGISTQAIIIAISIYVILVGG